MSNNNGLKTLGILGLLFTSWIVKDSLKIANKYPNSRKRKPKRRKW